MNINSTLDFNASSDEGLVRYTNRETEVLHLISLGLSNPEIAKVLHLSIYTVQSHRKTLMKKMGVHNTALMMRRAFETNLISL